MTTAPPLRQPLASAPWLIGGLVVGALWLVGCPPSLTCEDLGCDPGFVCNASTGNCQRAESDCSVSGCPPDTSCNPSTGQCEPLQQRCPQRPCPQSEVCNTETGTCQERKACRVGDCTSPAERCNETTGRCIPVECSSDPDCPSGFICGIDDRCRTGCRPASSNCPEGLYCRATDESSNGQCIPECEDNQDCPYGRFCKPRGGEFVCQPEPPCEIDQDCRSDEVCLRGSCTRPPCRTDDDCVAPSVCYRPTGQCIGSDCSDDVFSPNHRRASAASIGFDTYQELTLCPGLADWFRLPIRSGQPIRVRLVHDSERDADLHVYDEAGRLIGINEQAPSPDSGPETVNIIDFSAQRDGTAWIRVDRAEGGSTPAASDADSLNYELGIQTDPSDVCRDDSYEENDRRSEAIRIETAVDAPNNLGLDVCGGDEDWFVLPDLGASLGLEVEVTETEPAAGVVLTLLSPDGKRLSVPSGTPLNLQRLGASGDWYIHVASTRGRSSSYRLRAQTTDRWRCTRAGEYPSPLSARYVPVGPPETAWLCPDGDAWETDWFELADPGQRALLTATVSPPPVPEQLQVDLFRANSDSQGVTLIRRGIFDGEDIVVSARVPPTSLYLRVRSFSTLGMVRDPGPYEISYDYQLN